MSSGNNDKLFKQILESNEIRDPVSEIITKDFISGENLGSKIKLVTVKFEDAKKQPLHLFTKCLVDDAGHTKVIAECKFFEKEELFFTQYLSAARKFCEELGQEEILNIYPKCYYADGKLLVFENLVDDRGFILLNKEEQQDYDAAWFAVTSIAKHHALSRALIKHEGGPEYFFKRYAVFNFEAYTTQVIRDMLETAIENAITRQIDILERTDVEGKDKALSILKCNKGKSYDNILELLKSTPEETDILVLNHGDYWNNNMMFKRDTKTGKFIDHVIVDFQIGRYASPCIDLHFFLFTSIKSPVRQEKLTDLLKAYYKQFSTTSGKLGYPLDLSFDQFFQNFRKYAQFGLWMNVAMNNGLGFKALKELKPEELAEFGSKMNELVQKWLDNHPEEWSNLATGIVAVLDQYTNLQLS